MLSRFMLFSFIAIQLQQTHSFSMCNYIIWLSNKRPNSTSLNQHMDWTISGSSGVEQPGQLLQTRRNVPFRMVSRCGDAVHKPRQSAGLDRVGIYSSGWFIPFHMHSRLTIPLYIQCNHIWFTMQGLSWNLEDLYSYESPKFLIPKWVTFTLIYHILFTHGFSYGLLPTL